MNDVKNCDTCANSYYEKEKGCVPPERQHCKSPEYNSDRYTHEMFMEDWGRGYCRFWAPKKQKGILI